MSEGLLRVGVGSLDFFGHRGPFAIAKDGFTGWDDSTFRSASNARSNADGDYASTPYKEARIVTLKGYIVADRPERLDHYRERFMSALEDSSDTQVVVQRPWGVRWAPDAKIVERRYKEFGGLNRGEFTLVFKFDDPFKYGERRSVQVASGTSEAVFHRGTVDAWPRAYVSGNFPDGYTLTLGGQQVSVPMGIPAGATHTIDYRRRRLYVNGSLFMGAFGASNFRSVPPGQRTAVALSAPSGTGNATFTVYDTYD